MAPRKIKLHLCELAPVEFISSESFDFPRRTVCTRFPRELVRLNISKIGHLPAASANKPPSSLNVFSRMEQALAYCRHTHQRIRSGSGIGCTYDSEIFFGHNLICLWASQGTLWLYNKVCAFSLGHSCSHLVGYLPTPEKSLATTHIYLYLTH